MESKLLLYHRGLPPTTPRRNLTHMLKRSPPILAVIAKPKKNIAIETETMTIYNDNWFDRIAIHHLSQNVQTATGIKNMKTGYESLIEAATVVSKNYNPKKQQELVIQALQSAFPKPILSMVRTLLPHSKFTREFFAVFTTFFFSWLIGPCEVRESELEGSIEKNVVHIRKCREIYGSNCASKTQIALNGIAYVKSMSQLMKFLEGTSCVGMCTNLCKMPSQKFIKDSFGIPVNMVPNFEDMSCDMIFGEEPPAAMDDPAFKQPCYKFLCKAKRKHNLDCSSV